MRYFELATDCFLVEGQNEAALYDVHGGRLFLLDRSAHELLRSCADGAPVPDNSSEDAVAFLDALQAAGLGFFDDAAAGSDKLLLHQPIEWKGMCMTPPDFKSVDWQITNACDLDCRLCGDDDKTLSWQSCQTCLRRDAGGAEAWMPEDLEAFIADIANLGVGTLHIRGGEPLLAWQRLERIAQAAAETPLTLVVTTTGMGRPANDLIALGKGRRFGLNIVMFGHDDETSETACGRSGVLAAQVALIDALVEAQIAFSITFLLTPLTQGRRNAMQEFAQRRWRTRPAFSEVCTREDVKNGFRLSHLDERERKPLAPWESPEMFFFRVRNNTCTSGLLEIGADGLLRTCSGLPKVHGDVGRQGLVAALSGTGLYESWKRGKSDVEPCRRCALRYACSDCSSFEFADQPDANAKSAYCGYDPCDDTESAIEREWTPTSFVRPLRLRERA
ncbi:radical SAM protein [Roseitalea porphyridii]|uniref:Radical SAM protein n=1 Tax=Roseitalea porphyridii TaxID=1852022 RepID=A0A4P6V3W5_9HYPH|nr:radical SAM protein [Roseitalea porphyridii]QBK31935.1 hypothetical protein E0E05_15865 [Roseitalea porphyridii]